MKRSKVFALSTVLVTGLALTACSKCPQVRGDYDKVPYGQTRTAGSGTAVYGGNCPVEAAPKRAPVVKKAEKVFTKQQRK